MTNDKSQMTNEQRLHLLTYLLFGHFFREFRNAELSAAERHLSVARRFNAGKERDERVVAARRLSVIALIVVSASGQENRGQENSKSSIFLSSIFLSAGLYGRNDDRGQRDSAVAI
ncbi:MAG: hypothetical protein ACREEM_38170 [Blastocatellia bacterium]